MDTPRRVFQLRASDTAAAMDWINETQRVAEQLAAAPGIVARAARVHTNPQNSFQTMSSLMSSRQCPKNTEHDVLNSHTPRSTNLASSTMDRVTPPTSTLPESVFNVSVRDSTRLRRKDDPQMRSAASSGQTHSPVLSPSSPLHLVRLDFRLEPLAAPVLPSSNASNDVPAGEPVADIVEAAASSDEVSDIVASEESNSDFSDTDDVGHIGGGVDTNLQSNGTDTRAPMPSVTLDSAGWDAFQLSHTSPSSLRPSLFSDALRASRILRRTSTLRDTPVMTAPVLIARPEQVVRANEELKEVVSLTAAASAHIRSGHVPEQSGLSVEAPSSSAALHIGDSPHFLDYMPTITSGGEASPLNSSAAETLTQHKPLSAPPVWNWNRSRRLSWTFPE